MNELRVSAQVTPGVITFNSEELKKDVERQLAEIKGATFDEEAITTAKALVAQLRSKVKEANAEAIKIDKIYSAPCVEFRAEVKAVNAIIEAAITEITTQLDEHEEKRKAKKREDIKAIYESIIDVFGEYLPLDKIYNTQWENKTFTIAKVTEEINNLIDSTAQAITTITSMNSEAVPKALELYKADLSIVNAITYINNYESQKAEIEAKNEAKRKADEEERARAEERKRIEEQLRHENELALAEERAKREALAVIEEEKKRAVAEALEEIRTPMAAKEISADDPLLNVLFAVTATQTEIEQIEMYLDSIGVEYAKES